MASDAQLPAVPATREPAPPDSRRGRLRSGVATGVGAMVVIGAKVEIVAHVAAHPATYIVACSLAVVVSFLRGRLLATAIGGGVLAGLVSAIASVPLGLAVGAGVFVLLLTLFYAISTVMHIRDTRRAAPGRPGRRGRRHEPPGAR